MDKPNEQNNYSLESPKKKPPRLGGKNPSKTTTVWNSPQKKPPRLGGKNPSHQCLVEEVQAQGEKVARSRERGMKPPNTAVGIRQNRA